jgi:sec-independent protein translocase protein TatA
MPLLAGLGPLGVPELLIIAFIVILVFGVGRLPEVGGALGKGIREFRKSTREEDDESPPGGNSAAVAATSGGGAASADVSMPDRLSADVAPPPAQSADVVFCGECGARNPRDAKFCAECGKSITAAVR